MSYQIPTQFPIPSEEMFFNGRLTQSWYRFFLNISMLADTVGSVNLLDLWLLASVLPAQAQIAEQAAQIAELQLLAGTAATSPTLPQTEIMPPATIPQENQPQIMPLSTAAFLCPQEMMPMVQVSLTTNEWLPALPLNDDFLQVINP